MSGIPAGEVRNTPLEESEGEGLSVDMDKVRTAAAIVRGAQELIPLADRAASLVQEYWDVIGVEGLSTTELEYLGIKADNMTGAVNLLDNLAKFVQGEDTVKTQYRLTLNRIRRTAAQV